MDTSHVVKFYTEKDNGMYTGTSVMMQPMCCQEQPVSLDLIKFGVLYFSFSRNNKISI